jgi:hypothetical protein
MRTWRGDKASLLKPIEAVTFLGFIASVSLAFSSFVYGDECCDKNDSSPITTPTDRLVFCSTSICDRSALNSEEVTRLESTPNIGLEISATRKPPFKAQNYTNPSGFNCNFIVLFPSDHGLYTPNGEDSWQSFIPAKKSRLLWLASGEDEIYLLGREKRNFIHSYFVVRGKRSGKPFIKTESMSAISLDRKILPGLSMAELQMPCAPDDVTAGDEVNIYIPKPEAYSRGVDKERGDLSPQYFSRIDVSTAIGARFSSIFK